MGNWIKRPKFVLGIALIVAAVGMFVAVPISQAASEHAAVATSDPSYTCGGDTSLTISFSNPPKDYDAAKVISVSWKVVNDEDSGYYGYWAMDTYKDTLNVWFLKAGPYAGEYYYTDVASGNFQTPQGATSPGTGVTENAPGYGTLSGAVYGFVTATAFSPGGNPTSGNLGVLNYNGTTADILANNDTNQLNSGLGFYWWVTTYFTSGATTGGSFGFVYNLNGAFEGASSINQWCDFGAGSYGDIVANW